MTPYEMQMAPAAEVRAVTASAPAVTAMRIPRGQRARAATVESSEAIDVPRTGAPAAFAELSQGLAHALMQGVQRVAQLNIDTTRALLVQGGSVTDARLEVAADAWRFSWRSYEVCATTAATILKLCQSQARASFDDLWRALEDGLAQLPQASLAHVRETRVAFEAMRAAYSAYFDAALATHRALLSLAEGAR